MIRFADTFYFIALFNRLDNAHKAAMDRGRENARIVTTEWVLAELADALSTQSKRRTFVEFYESVRHSDQIEVVPASHDWFERGLRLYANRPDKDWSLTDCISFVVMQQRGLTEALTGDRHFEQAGFCALLKA